MATADIGVQDQSLKALAERLYQGKLWIQLVGAMSILYGVIMALTIVGILVAWIPIWAGVILFQATSAIEEAYNNNDQAALSRGLDKLRLYFMIFGIMFLVGIAIGILGFLVGGVGALTVIGGA